MLPRFVLLLLLMPFSPSSFYMASAGIITERYYRDQAHPGKCVINGSVLSPGQSAQHPTLDCAEVTCANGIGLVSIERCDAISDLPSPLSILKNYDANNPPQCTWGDFSNLSAPYPKCCQRNFSCIF